MTVCFQQEDPPEKREVLKDLLPDEMEALFLHWGLERYRARQVMEWIYRHCAMTFGEMTNLSKALRRMLDERCEIGHLRVEERYVSRDGTEKWLLRLNDGLFIETVLIPEGMRWTQCISTQVGCALGCRFCRTGKMGLLRNLRAWEIVDQIVIARRELRHRNQTGRPSDPSVSPSRISNFVLMGMGEPLANYGEVIRALRLMLSPWGLDISKRRITLSTVGLIPEIKRFMEEGLGIKLAVSLNAPTERIRNRLMPVNRTYPLKTLIKACRELPLPPRARITFEYVLIKGVNDTLHDARMLTRLLRGLKCKINLIPYNPFPGSEFMSPDEKEILSFQKILLDANYTATLRKSRGADIMAACGQLAAKPSS